MKRTFLAASLAGTAVFLSSAAKPAAIPPPLLVKSVTVFWGADQQAKIEGRAGKISN